MFKREALDLMSLPELSEIASALGFSAGKQGKEDLINSILREQEQFITGNAEPVKEEAAAPKAKRGKKAVKESVEPEPEIFPEMKEEVPPPATDELQVDPEIKKPGKRVQSPLDMEARQDEGKKGGRKKRPIEKPENQIAFLRKQPLN